MAIKHILVATFITLLALGTGCAWISPASETASDGIQVHGHWTVTVTNPDGTLDAVHEFENELLDQGEAYTALILNEASATGFFIDVRNTYTDDNLACQGGTNSTFPSNNRGTSKITGTATRDLNTEGTPIVIRATCTVEQFSGSIQITEVRHGISFDQAIATKYSPTPALVGRYVTSHVFPSSQQIEVQNGQSLSFNVIISFN